MQTIPGGDRRILTVTDALRIKDSDGIGAIYAILKAEDGEELIKVFTLSDSGTAENYVEFALACGLNEGEARSGNHTLLIGRKVAAEVFENGNGEPDAWRWSRVEGKGR
jgi:hypothetical protein